VEHVQWRSEKKNNICPRADRPSWETLPPATLDVIEKTGESNASNYKMSFESNTKLCQTAALQYSTAQSHQIPLPATITAQSRRALTPKCANADACPTQMKNCLKYAILYRKHWCQPCLLGTSSPSRVNQNMVELAPRICCANGFGDNALLAAQPRLRGGPIDNGKVNGCSAALSQTCQLQGQQSAAEDCSRRPLKSFTLVGSGTHSATELACNEICCSGQTEER
jgi:hypothetical protein